MKKLSILALFVCLLGGFAQAATLSGLITNPSNNPVANQTVYVSDSLNMFSANAATNAQGVYTINIPANTLNGMQLHVWTAACGTAQNSYPIYNGNNVTVNFSNPCPVLSSYTLQGSVTLGGVANTGVADVYLIHATYDSSALSWMLTLVDSATTTSAGAYSMTYAAIPSGTLYLKAALRSSHPNYTGFLPTYYGSSLLWSGATALTNANFINNATTNINMTAGVNPGGPGFIGGSVLQGANKTAGVGDPLSRRLILLTTLAGQPVAYTYSDAGGQFSFPNLAYGTYKIFGDAWGKQNPALIVTISGAQPSVSNITFEENSGSFEGQIGGLSVGTTPASLSGVRVFPNPATDRVQLVGLDAVAGAKTLTLAGISGAVVERQSIAQGEKASVSLMGLPAGVYTLRVQTAEGAASFKVLK